MIQVYFKGYTKDHVATFYDPEAFKSVEQALQARADEVGMTMEVEEEDVHQMFSYNYLHSKVQAKLHEIVFNREHDINQPEKYYKNGGFFYYWTNYTEEEREAMLEEANA